MKPYRIPTGVYQYLQEHPFISGKELSEALGIPGRTARRYVRMYVNGAAVPKEEVPSSRHSEDVVFSVPSVQMRTAIFDIEVTDFKTEGYKGFLVCCSILSLDRDQPKTFAIRFEERGDDRRLLRDVLSELCTYDILSGHNIAAFDLPWLYSRALYHKVRGEIFPLRRWAYFDTFQTAKALGLSTSKSLGNLSDFFGLNGIKTRIYPTSWSDVRSPYRQEFDAALADIVHHCEHDVRANRKLFDVLWWPSFDCSQPQLKRSRWSNFFEDLDREQEA